MSATKQKGDLAEVYAVYQLKRNGFNVLVPWGEDNRYDLVSEKKGVFKRIQVKYVSSKNGALQVSIRSSNNFNVIHYSARDVDIIAAVDIEQGKIYFIPLKGLKNRSLCKLRLSRAKNNQLKNIILASQFESRFDFLER
ncbi:MAG: group I intron-associated PD-(D/E)XK endonuclease [Candidatus Omnitrophota bacterium]